MRLETAIKYMNAEASALDPALMQMEVSSFPTDSREVKAGEVFFAFSQPEFENNCFNGDFMDATSFVAAAIKKGAIAAVVRRDRFEENREELESIIDKLIFADDVIVAFQRLAHRVYLDWNGPVVAVTGSAGKTTAKELTAHLLRSSGRKILRNEKNLNNGLGLPITVLKLAQDDSFDAAVLEMGMSTPNREIARLCEITPPDIAVELNVLPVHVEHLGSIENVAKAKAELIEGMKADGTAVLNADDQRVAAMKELRDVKTITYGIENPADISAESIEMKQFGETHFTLKTPDGDEKVVFQLSGKHNVLNALAASAVGYSFGMTAKEISDSLNNVKPPSQRGEILHFEEGFTVINDSYNSNPAALLKMTNTLMEGTTDVNRKIVVAGEMLELGEEEKEIHRETGRELSATGIDMLIGVRNLAKDLIDAANEKGLNDARFFEGSELAGEYLAKNIRKDDVVLVKGSRGVRTEKVIEKLLEKYPLVKN
ncbi:MAG: UDP-N-acetylmuramoyl-tripeptide--D-alanyl-D-alanine ligase [Pyrinomonadaceae bacterium]|nr:UDP-N-acetylmuramoyl-tripeptide--D-alanyl-D-alanine ligase [Pyrinomonadaceae bacterium]